MAKSVKVLLFALCAAFIVWLPLAIANLGGQRYLFLDAGKDWFCDFWIVRITLEVGYSQPSTGDFKQLLAEHCGWMDENSSSTDKPCYKDRCYPPLGMLPLKPFPINNAGAYGWMVVSALTYLLLCWLAVRRSAALLIAFSYPFLFNLCQCNTIALAAGAIAVFLAYYRSERLSLRLLAAISLGVAAAMKMSPALLGVLYLPEILDFRQFSWRNRSFIGYAALSAAVFFALFLLPFALMPDGFGGISQFFINAAENGRFFASRASFGFGAVCRTIQIVAGIDWRSGNLALTVCRIAGQVFGFAILFVGAFRRSRILTVAGFILAVPNMLFYGLLYLLPAIALDIKERAVRTDWLFALLVFVIVCPLQLVHATGGGVLVANGPLANFALIALIFSIALSGQAANLRRFWRGVI